MTDTECIAELQAQVAALVSTLTLARKALYEPDDDDLAARASAEIMRATDVGRLGQQWLADVQGGMGALNDLVNEYETLLKCDAKCENCTPQERAECASYEFLQRPREALGIARRNGWLG